MRGRVTSVREFGAFVRMLDHNKDGLVHISQVANVRVEVDELKRLLPVGSLCWAKVLSVDADGKKVSLSTKLVGQDSGEDLDPGHTGAATKKPSESGPSATPAGSTTRFAEPTGPVPELFSIHRAKVSSGTDFAIFVTLESGGWDVMVHTTQLDQELLRTQRAKAPTDVYKVGSSLWVKISAKDGYSRKAKLQGSVKYVAQDATGKDLDHTSEKLLLDLTTRGMRSELESRWSATGQQERSPSPERDGAEQKQFDALVGVRAAFVPSERFVGAREGYVFKTGDAGLGYYCESGGRGAAALMLEQVMLQLKEDKRSKKKEKKVRRSRLEPTVSPTRLTAALPHWGTLCAAQEGEA